MIPAQMLQEMLLKKFPATHPHHALVQKVLEQQTQQNSAPSSAPQLETASVVRAESMARTADARAVSAMQETARISQELAELRSNHVELTNALSENKSTLAQVLEMLTKSNSH